MRILLLFFFAVLFGREAVGQNLVPNASFENVTLCPYAHGLEFFTSDWKSARATPDYFNTCATYWGADVPNNYFGYQQPHAGNGYIGLLTYRTDTSLYTEAASVQLTSPLIAGQTYYVSFRLNLVLDYVSSSTIAHNKIGVQFSTTEYSPSNPLPINNFAHVWSDSIMTDTMNWSLITGTFVADTTYTHLSLGNFFEKPFINSIVFDSLFFWGGYYFFDDVCVSMDSTLCYQYVGVNELNKTDLAVSIYPNPASDYMIIETDEPYSLHIYNSLGQMLYQEENINTNYKEINTFLYNKGLIVIEINTTNNKHFFL